MTEELDVAASKKADALRERLKAEGIAWQEHSNSSEYEDSFGENFGSRSSTEILVAEADAERARAILAELA